MSRVAPVMVATADSAETGDFLLLAPARLRPPLASPGPAAALPSVS